jgi:hypothetical protein
VRALLLFVALGAFAVPATGHSREVIGYAGHLGEWELTATVAENVRTQEFSGPLTMRHVGICTQDGPEEKSGEIRLQVSESSVRMSASLLIDGVKCSYDGRLSESYTGPMSCVGREAVPLTLWIK